MPFYTTYSASLTQTGSGTITASLDAKGNAITGSWTRLSAGIYQFVSSGNFAPTVSSGSITGSLGIRFTYAPNNQNNTSSGFVVYNTSSNALVLQTFSTGNLSDNTIKGSFQLQIGILSGSI
jgi:hypothetical protein